VPAAADAPALVRDPGLVQKDMCEVSPIVWNERLCLLKCVRPASGGTVKDYYLEIVDTESGSEIAPRFAEGYGLASAFVHDGAVYVSASRFENNDWNDVTVFVSKDLKKWEQHVAITQTQKEHLFNSSVSECADGFVMAYESNDPAYPAFTIKFAKSKDLVTWEKVPDALLGADRYAACPTIRFADGFYYVLYLEHRKPKWFFETCIVRSKDLKSWTLGSGNPVLTPSDSDDGINASDPDLVEFDGKTYLYFAVGDQKTWMNIKRAVYPESVRHFLQGWFSGPGTEVK
jgi:alpha-L-fucosidase